MCCVFMALGRVLEVKPDSYYEKFAATCDSACRFIQPYRQSSAAAHDKPTYHLAAG